MPFYEKRMQNARYFSGGMNAVNFRTFAIFREPLA